MILRLYVALVHWPVINIDDAEITATIDEFDIFDACRVTLVYPVRRLLIVQPIPAQQALVERLLAHGQSAERKPERGRFDQAQLVPTLSDAIDVATEDAGTRPTVVATTVQANERAIGYSTLRQRIHEGEPVMLLIGKASGLAERVIRGADAVLEPIRGGTGFDHLPVRAATAILLDRLVGLHR